MPLPGGRGSEDAPNPLQMGQDAFAVQEYGRAERHFLLAAANPPDEAKAYFFLAQVRFALGKYQEAVEAVHAGMRLHPDWPSLPLQPRDLYGADRAEFVKHLQRLANAQARFPDDPALLFLLGHQLWFDGERERARRLLERAAGIVVDKDFLQRFLAAQ